MAHLLSRRDLDFLLYEWLDITSLTEREKFSAHSRETFDGVLDLSADLAEKLFAPHNKAGDQNPPYVGDDGKVVLIDDVKTATDAYADADLIAAPFPEALGGMDLPSTISRASMAWFQAANPGTSSYALLTTANANLLVAHGSPEQIDTWCAHAGRRYSGHHVPVRTPGGSSLADITTRPSPPVTGPTGSAAPDVDLRRRARADREHRPPGTCQGTRRRPRRQRDLAVHRAEVPCPTGPRNDVALVGLNHKMGNRGTTNTLLNFGDGSHPVPGGSGAVGYLVGQEHRGLFYMFHMMNEARIGVGFLATAIGYAGYLASLDYAKVRTQGRPPWSKDAASAPVPIIEARRREADAAGAEVLRRGSVGAGAVLFAARRHRGHLRSRRTRSGGLLLGSTHPDREGVAVAVVPEANNLAIQVHGGYGYTTEFDVEQCYRDNRLNPIHEGTNGIQGIDLLGRKVVMDGGAGLTLLYRNHRRDDRPGTLRRRDRRLRGALRAALDDLVATTATLWADANPAVALTNSSVYLQAAGHIVLAWMWLDQLLAVGDKTGDFYDGKRAAARYFFQFELPTVGPQLALCKSLDQTTAETDPAWF